MNASHLSMYALYAPMSDSEAPVMHDMNALYAPCVIGEAGAGSDAV